jgi:hypothetical protein
MKMKKILPYLLLNIVVSAATMLAVILIWNAFHPSVIATDNLEGLLTSTQQTDSILPSLNERTVEIQSVFMPGELQYEKVNLQNVGAEPIDLSGWSIVNEKGASFIFPSLTLFPEGAVAVYSQSGVNTAVELFWNSAQALWQSGQVVVLFDSAQNERSRYLIP